MTSILMRMIKPNNTWKEAEMDWQQKKAKLDKLMSLSGGHMFLGYAMERTPEQFYTDCWDALPRIQSELKARMDKDVELLKHLNGIFEIR